MLFALDVGNTNIVMGLYDENELITNFRIATNERKTSDEIGLMFTQFMQLQNKTKEDISGVIISSVVPPLMHSLLNAVRRYIGHEAIIVNHRTDLGISLEGVNASEVGTDRLVNAAAACSKYKGPLIVVDFGTATTFCAVSGKNEYLGGIIAPGVKISMEALFEHASQLFRVEIKKPDKVIGTSTVLSMQSGAVYGYVGQVEHLVKMIREELGVPDCKVIATGGLANFISRETDVIDIVDKNLTLDGLNYIYRRIK